MERKITSPTIDHTLDLLLTAAMDEAYKFVCDKRFHRSLWIPETAEHPRLRVTFSTTTNFDDATLPAVLVCNPMFGTRYFAQDVNHLANICGVRVIFVDR